MAIKGLQQTLRQLDTWNETIKEDVRDVVEEYTLIIQREAIRNAPAAGDELLLNSSSVASKTGNTQKNTTGINQYIFASFDVKSKGMIGTIGVEEGASKLAAYIEFGTGVSAAGYVPTLPTEFQQMARKYYINGRGTLLKQPFLLPAYFSNRFPFLKALQSTLKSHGIDSVLIP